MFLTKARPEAVVRGTGDPEIDCEGRFLTLVYKEVIIVNSYAPTLGLYLTGADRKTKFWEAACKNIVELQNKYPGRRLLWVGDLNTAPLDKDIDDVGIRRSLEASSIHKQLQKELPCATVTERAELEAVLDKFNLVDAFENQLDKSKGRDATGAERYTQFMHGNRPRNVGQRIDLALTDMKMGEPSKAECMGVVSCRVHTAVHCSDHLPLEVRMFVNSKEVIGSILDREKAEKGRGDGGQEWEVGEKVLVDRRRLTHVAADTVHNWIPATVKIVAGQLLRVRIAAHWLHPGAKYDIGVTSAEIKHSIEGAEPPRFVVGEQVIHFRNKKPGTVTEVVDRRGKAHSYNVMFEGTVSARLCGPNMLRAAPSHPSLASAEQVPESVFERIATDTARKPTKKEIELGTGTEEHIVQACGCRGEGEPAPEGNKPETPHTREIKVGGVTPYAMIDTGAGPNMLRTEWLEREIPNWNKQLCRKEATTTRFKLADMEPNLSVPGAKSSSR
jgi:exonuclease III